MKIYLSPEILNIYPGHTFAFGVLRNPEIFGPNKESKAILEKSYPEVKEKYKVEDLEKDLNSIAYVNFAKKIGSVRFGFPHLQIKRVLEGGRIGNINNVVNNYMVFELLNNLSFSAYDLDSIEGDIVVDVAAGGEIMKQIRGGEAVIAKGDLILRDKNGAFYAFCAGYADRTKVSNQTKNVLYVIDAPEGVNVGVVEKNMKNLCALFDSSDCHMLDNRNTAIDI